MRVSGPIAVQLPAFGVLFAESSHAPDFRMAGRVDPFHKVIYVLKGRVAYRATRPPVPVVAGAGSILVVPRGERHQLVDEVPSTLLLLCLSDDFLAADPELPELWRGLARPARRRPELSRWARQELEEMWRRAMAQRHDGRPGGSVIVRALAAQILAHLARVAPEPTGDDASARVAAVVAEVEASFYERWNVDRAAARAGLSRRRFTDLFRFARGTTFWEFLTERRLQHAARLLRAGGHSILGVMATCGFEDLSHFYRMFGRRFGVAPAAWARTDAARKPQNAPPRLKPRAPRSGAGPRAARGGVPRSARAS